jgi:hypothetical protein
MAPQLDLTLSPVHNAAGPAPIQLKKKILLPKKAKDGTYDGVRYVTTSGLVFVQPNYNTDTIKAYSKQYYGAALASKLQNLLFTGDFKILVKDAAGEEDPEISQLMQAMAYNVGLWGEMRSAFVDVCWWGLYVSNPVWAWVDNTYTLVDLVRLPPESFSDAPPGTLYTYSELLQGVILNETDGTPGYYQTINGVSKQITNVFAIRNPYCQELAGEPLFRPLFPVFTYLKFSWESTMQAINRIGAPILFIKVNGGDADDITYADTVLKNWGKNMAFQLRENMELINPGLSEPRTPMEAIGELTKMVIDYFSPATLIQNTNATLSSSDAGSSALLSSFIRGVHSWIEDGFESLLQTYLTANGYEGYTTTIELMPPEADRTDTNIRIAQAGDQVRALKLNEKRELLGLPPLPDEEIAALQGEYQSTPAMPGNPSFVTHAMRFYNAANKKKSLT